MAEPTKRADRAEIAKRVERAEKLLQKGKTAEALQEYFGVLGEGYVRLSYANSTENILRALGRMGEFLTSRKAA